MVNRVMKMCIKDKLGLFECEQNFLMSQSKQIGLNSKGKPKYRQIKVSCGSTKEICYALEKRYTHRKLLSIIHENKGIKLTEYTLSRICDLMNLKNNPRGILSPKKS